MADDGVMVRLGDEFLRQSVIRVRFVLESRISEPVSDRKSLKFRFIQFNKDMSKEVMIHDYWSFYGWSGVYVTFKLT